MSALESAIASLSSKLGGNPSNESALLSLTSSSSSSDSTIGANLAGSALALAPAGPAGLAVSSGTKVLASIVKSVGGHPGPGKIYQADCQAAEGYARQKGVSVKWDPKAWTMTGHCVVTGPDAWNVSLALMKGKNDPRVCKTLIPTESGICPVVCSKAAAGPATGSQCRMPNANGKISGKSGAPSCLSQPGNCAQSKPDTGSYVPTAKNPAPSLDDLAHIQAVLRQGGTLHDLSADQIGDLALHPGAAGNVALSGVLSSLGLGNITPEKVLLFLIIGGVAVITLIAAIL